MEKSCPSFARMDRPEAYPTKKKPAGMPCDIAAGKGSEERRSADHISKPRPTMGTKSWRILPYFTLLLGGVMISVGNAVM